MAVVLSLPENGIAVPVLLDGIAKDMRPCGDLPLAHTFQPHFANLFVNFHCNNHLCSSPIYSDAIIKDAFRWLNYS